MSIDPQTLRTESHTEVGMLVQRGVTILIERWARRAVEEQPNAERVHHAVLLDNLQELLAMLGRSLIEAHQPEHGTHCLSALKHGEQRWEAGWSLPEVVRDYQILRLVVLEYLEENLDRPLGYREVLAVGLALDEAIAASTVMYVQSRDDHLGQVENRRLEEEKRRQAALQAHARDLQEADRRKNEFLAMLAHELRNPLAPVLNAVQILRLNDLSGEHLAWARDVIERQVQIMVRMVEDLLDLSRIAQGKVSLRREAVELSSVMNRALEISRPIIEARQHRLAVELPSEPVWLDADPPRLVQALTNLLINAAKYTGQGGELGLVATPQGAEVVIRVRDSGTGISPELLPHIFDPFFQEGRSSDLADGGLGLGLALVRSWVELHGGRVEAFSGGRDQGSEFVIHLPTSQPKQPTTAVDQARTAPGATTSQRILVVDDNTDAAETLSLLLRLEGHQVRTAHDGPAALTAAKAQAPQVVLLDLGLPRMDGFEVARRLRHEVGLKDTLLVALTGSGQDQDRRRSQEAGFAAHLLKPVDLDELRRLLSSATSRTEASGSLSRS